MNILHLAANRNLTGSAAPTLALASRLQASGHEVHFACMGGHHLERFAREAGLSGVHVLRFDANGLPWRLRADARRMREIVAAHNIKLVHCHRSVDHFIARLALGPRPRKVPIVRTYHEPLGAPPGFFARLLFRRATDRLIAVTEKMGEGLRGRLSAMAGRIESIAGAVDTDRFAPKDPARGRELVGVPEGRRVLGMNSKLSPDRGVDRVVRVFARLQNGGRIGDAHLLLVGSESPEPYGRMAASLGVEGRVTAINRLDDLVVERLRAMDVAVQLVPGRDGSARAALEMMALGKPVIAGRTGALAELFEAGWGRIIGSDTELEAAVEELLNDPALREKLGRSARERAVERHGIASWVTAYERAYAEALGRGRRGQS